MVASIALGRGGKGLFRWSRALAAAGTPRLVTRYIVVTANSSASRLRSLRASATRTIRLIWIKS
jgi:hypothetical protein